MSYSSAPVSNYAACILSLGTYSCIPGDTWSGAVAATAAWPTANLAVYVPVRIPTACVVKKLALSNGSAVTGNFDIGIYNAAGSRLVSTGSTAQSGTATEQVVGVTDTALSAGLYYFAACHSSTGSVMAVSPVAPIAAAHGVLTEAVGAVTLPATASWAVDQTIAVIPLVLAFLDPTVA
jgi:hypothetical protein